jgi:hypothetical protein
MSMELAKYDESGLIAAKSIRAAAMRKLQEAQRAIEQQKELPLEPEDLVTCERSRVGATHRETCTGRVD